MATANDNAFCYAIAGFWVEIPEDSSQVDIYLLPRHDREGSEGRPTEYPVKQLGPKLDEQGEISQPATLLAARVWCNHAADQIRNNFEPDFDGDGTAPLKPLALPLASGDTDQAMGDVDASAWSSVAQEAKPAKPKRQSKKG